MTAVTAKKKVKSLFKFFNYSVNQLDMMQWALDWTT